MYCQQHLPLSSSLLSLGSKLGQWKQEERPTVWLKNTTANFRLIHTYAALPLFPSVCPKDTPQPKPTGKQGQRESRPEPILPCTCFTVFRGSGCKLGGKCFCFTFTFSLSSIWKAKMKEGSWANTYSKMVNEEHFHHFRCLTWFVVDLYGEKAALYLTFLLHACFTWEQQSAAMEWSAVHSWDDCRDKQGESLINMKLIMCHSLHLCRLSLYSRTNECRRTTSVGIFTHRTTAAQPRPFHSYSHMTADWRFV